MSAAPIKTAPSPQPAQPMMRVFTTASALALLWQKASDTMSPPELEWFADGAAEQVGRDARTLADVLEGTACLVANDEETGSFRDADSTSTLLFNLQNQLNTIAGLADIAADAGFMVRKALKGGQA